MAAWTSLQTFSRRQLGSWLVSKYRTTVWNGVTMWVHAVAAAGFHGTGHTAVPTLTVYDDMICGVDIDTDALIEAIEELVNEG